MVSRSRSVSARSLSLSVFSDSRLRERSMAQSMMLRISWSMMTEVASLYSLVRPNSRPRKIW